MGNLDDIIEQIKRANPIEEVAKDLGFKFEREGGKYRRVPHSGGLVVNTAKQRFFWAEKGWNGDVIALVEKERGWEFKTAAEWLADRAGIPRPGWGQMDDAALKASRIRLSVFEVAHKLFVEWLWADKEAIAYLRGRGFSDELIRASGMGFSGRRSDAQIKEMRQQFGLYGADCASAAAVAILGFQGDVRSWARDQRIDLSENGDWYERGWVAGMMGTPGIVYAHQWAGRVVYFSRRNLPGHDDVKSFNPAKCLVGVRQPYFNHVYRSDAEECAVVEGPADAETFASWGMSAAALCGVSVDDEGIGGLKGRLRGHKKIYLALDDDPAGRQKRELVAETLGPLTRIVDWEYLTGAREEAVA
jgi:hypothetical protein